MYGLGLGVVALVGALSGANAKLQTGVSAYRQGEYARSLRALTEALDVPSSGRELARIHVYIGLIQHRYALLEDARASFRKALDHNPKLKFPAVGSDAARGMFDEVRGGAAPAVTRAEKPTKKRRGARKRGRRRRSRRRARAVAKAPVRVVAPPEVIASGPSEAVPLPAEDPVAAAAAADDPGAELPGLKSKGAHAGAVAPPGASGLEVSLTPARRDRTPVWVSLGVGATATVVGAVFLGLAYSSNSSAHSATTDASQAISLHERARGQRTVAVVGFGVGAIAAGVAGALHFLRD